MYVLEKMKLHRFEKRPIVSARSLFAAKGAQNATVTSKLGADCFDAPNVDGASKTKLLGLMDDMAKAAWLQRETNGQAKPLTPTNAVDK